MEATDNLEKNYTSIFQSINEKMKDRLDVPLHIAGYFLNPYYFYKDPSIQYDMEVMDDFMSCVETFFHGDFEKQNKVVNREVNLYKNKLGSFGRSLALKGCESKEDFDPGYWWTIYGCGAPILQRLATRILALTSISSGCEKNWSCFEEIHTKKWNRLDVNHLNHLVYDQFNSRLFNKHKKIREQNVDVIFDDGNETTVEEWMVEQPQEFGEGFDVNFVLTIQAPRIRDFYTDDFESDEENLLVIEFEADGLVFDGVFCDTPYI